MTHRHDTTAADEGLASETSVVTAAHNTGLKLSLFCFDFFQSGDDDPDALNAAETFTAPRWRPNAATRAREAGAGP